MTNAKARVVAVTIAFHESIFLFGEAIAEEVGHKNPGSGVGVILKTVFATVRRAFLLDFYDTGHILMEREAYTDEKEEEQTQHEGAGGLIGQPCWHS